MLKVKNYLLVIVSIIICLVLVGCTLKTDLPINNEQVTQQPEQAKELTTEEISELENDYIPYFHNQIQLY
jgi:outer membrane biogenesis lipoprotein LolB